MRRKTAGIIQSNGGWHGVSFYTRGRTIEGVTFFADRSLEDARRLMGGTSYGLALDNGSAFLFNLAFPFSGRRKIRLVLGNDLEQRLPVSVEDMKFDFVGNGTGKVLAAAVLRNVIADLGADRQAKTVTIQSLAALHALRWLRCVKGEDFVFVHMSENTVVVMAFKEGSVHYLRQFFHSAESDALESAFEHLLNDKAHAPRSFIMIGDGSEIEAEKKRLQGMFHVVIETPSVADFTSNTDPPDWGWSAIGAALMALEPGRHINLAERRTPYSLLSSKAGLYGSASLACLGLLVWGLSYLDYSLKDRTFKYLSGEPRRIYRTSFPKSPPVKDPVVAFRDRIKALDIQPGSLAASANPLIILDQVSANIPADIDVKVDEFASDDKEFALSGTTVSFAAAEKIKSAIERIRGVFQVEVSNLEYMGNRQVKFKIKGKL